MPYSLQFEFLHQYALDDRGICLPVRLSVGTRRADVTAHVDTGAGLCIFGRECGEHLGLRVEDGLAARVGTPTGGVFRAFGHTVTLNVLALSFETTVYFSELPDFPRNVLGRRGWLNLVRLALIDYEGRLYLDHYRP